MVTIKELRNALNDYIDSIEQRTFKERLCTKETIYFDSDNFVLLIKVNESMDEKKQVNYTYFISISLKNCKLITSYEDSDFFHALGMVNKCMDTFLNYANTNLCFKNEFKHLFQAFEVFQYIKE